MHEFLLFGQVSSNDYQTVLQQLAGVTRMQPVPCKEIHLVFKARPPFSGLLPPMVGGSQDISTQDAQRARSLLSGTTFYLQLVGDLQDTPRLGNHLESKRTDSEKVTNGDTDVHMTNGEQASPQSLSKLKWRTEFRDIPDAGKQAVSVRLMSSFALDGSDFVCFLSNLGYE